MSDTSDLVRRLRAGVGGALREEAADALERLERELASLRAGYIEMERELAEARKDTERLDNGPAFQLDCTLGVLATATITWRVKESDPIPSTLRELLDAAKETP